MESLTPEQLSFIIQFLHPEKTAGFRAPPTDAMLAPVFNVDVATYSAVKKAFADNAKRAAAELLTDSKIAAGVDRLPFSRGATIVGLGDSITDDYQSWLEILRHMLALRRPADNIRVVNAGVSGDTTSQIISRFVSIVYERPEWILCLAGSNDTRLHGLAPTKTLLSHDETAKNFDMLRQFAAKQTSAKWAWLTPLYTIEEAIPKHWFLGPMQLAIRNSDLIAVADIVRRQPGPIVDLQKVIGFPPNPEMLLSDGLHPSLAGQKAIVTALIATLS